MAEYHVGCGAFAIYAGTLNKAKTMWKDKTACTEEAIHAVKDYMISDLLGGRDCKKAKKSGYAWKMEDGRRIIMTIEIEGGEEND